MSSPDSFIESQANTSERSLSQTLGSLGLVEPGKDNIFPLMDGRIGFDTDQLIAVCDEKVLALRPREFVIGAFLASKVNTLVSRGVAAETILGNNGQAAINTLNVYVSRLRAKFNDKTLSDPRKGAIRTIYDLGFMSVSSEHLDEANTLWGAEGEPERVIADGRIITKPGLPLMKVGDVFVPLTNRESQLVDCLTNNLDTIVPYDEISMEVWGYVDQLTTAHVSVLIGRIRGKISASGGTRVFGAIQTIPGKGYRVRSTLKSEETT